MNIEVIKALKGNIIHKNINNGTKRTSPQNGSLCLISLYVFVIFIPNWFVYADLGRPCTQDSECVGPYMACVSKVCDCDRGYTDDNGSQLGGTCQAGK